METVYPVILVSSPLTISERALKVISKLLQINPHMSVCMSSRRILIHTGRHIKIPNELNPDEVLIEIGFKGKKVHRTQKYTLVELISDEKFDLTKLAVVLRHIEIDDMFRNEKEDKGEVVLDALEPETKKTKKKSKKNIAETKQPKRKTTSSSKKSKSSRKSKKGAKK